MTLLVGTIGITGKSVYTWLVGVASPDVVVPGWQALGVLLLVFFSGVGVTLIALKLPSRLPWWTSTRKLRYAVLDVVYLITKESASRPHDGTFKSYLGYMASEDRIARVRNQLIEDGLLKIVSLGGVGRNYELTGEGGAFLKLQRIRRRNLPKYYEELG